MGAVERILALSQIRQQDPRLCFVQVMVGFDRAFAAHHDGGRFTEFFDTDRTSN